MEDLQGVIDLVGEMTAGEMKQNASNAYENARFTLVDNASKSYERLPENVRTRLNNVSQTVTQTATDLGQRTVAQVEAHLPENVKKQLESLPSEVRAQVESAYKRLKEGEKLQNLIPEETKKRIEALPTDIRTKANEIIGKIQSTESVHDWVAPETIEEWKNLPGHLQEQFSKIPDVVSARLSSNAAEQT
jgi:cation transport regulator ChaB